MFLAGGRGWGWTSYGQQRSTRTNIGRWISLNGFVKLYFYNRVHTQPFWLKTCSSLLFVAHQASWAKHKDRFLPKRLPFRLWDNGVVDLVHTSLRGLLRGGRKIEERTCTDNNNMCTLCCCYLFGPVDLSPLPLPNIVMSNIKMALEFVLLFQRAFKFWARDLSLHTQ